jgi:maltoporin
MRLIEYFVVLHCLQSRIDLDQQLIENLLAGQTKTDFVAAEEVFKKGSYSKSVSQLTLSSGLPYDVPKDTAMTGKNEALGTVRVKAFDSYAAGATQISVQYLEAECYVGANPQPVMTGCLQPSGSIVLNEDTNAIDYTYTPATQTVNARTLQGFSIDSTKMRASADQPFFEDFQAFVDYYGTESYAKEWIDAAFDGGQTSFSRGDGDFTEYDFESRAGK